MLHSGEKNLWMSHGSAMDDARAGGPPQATVITLANVVDETLN